MARSQLILPLSPAQTVGEREFLLAVVNLSGPSHGHGFKEKILGTASARGAYFFGNAMRDCALAVKHAIELSTSGTQAMTINRIHALLAEH